jgi:hypothetical protein
MTQQEEKEEKQEKQEEKDEKERGEKTRNDPLSVIAWASVLIWAGFVFLAQNLLPGFLAGQDPWPLIFVGAGLIFLLEALVRVILPEYRRPVGGTVIFGLILIAIGVGDRIGWGVLGPLVLILIGAGIAVGAALRRR